MWCQLAALMKALHNPWCHLTSGFWWVSLAEYIPVLRVYSLLLQMTCFIRASARTASAPWVMRTRSLGCNCLLVYFPKCFCGMSICKTGNSIWIMCVCYASATLWTWFVIICDFVCCKWISELLVKCNVWCVMLNDAILVVNKLVWNPSWFRLTTRIIWAQVQKFERFGACFCTCALIIWSVLLQLVSEQNSILNTSYEYLKTKVFVCEKC
jgi:hypothetical protein